MKYKLIIFYLLIIYTLMGFHTDDGPDYMEYHKLIIEAEKLISEEAFGEALITYEQAFDRFDFVFLRDYKVASQLALYLGNKKKAFDYIKKGTAAGWELKDIRKNKSLKPLQNDPEWKTIEKSYKNVQAAYLAKIDGRTREKVQLMFKKDQKKAMGALFRIGNKSQEKYGSEKFAPHSENQMYELIEILEKDGYPGEKNIGNNFWMATILSHHNSISSAYNSQDTLYNFIRPKLIRAIENGEMSPYEFALVDDWQKAVVSERNTVGYGFLISPKENTLPETNQLRQKIGLRSIELRNKLVDVEGKTGMNFYLPDWIKGKINIE